VATVPLLFPSQDEGATDAMQLGIGARRLSGFSPVALTPTAQTAFPGTTQMRIARS